MKTSLEFRQAWLSQLIEGRIRRTSRMKTRKMTPTTISWRSQSSLRAIQNRTISSATLQTWPCGLNSEAETSVAWALTSQPCTKPVKRSKESPAMPTQRKMVQSLQACNSNGSVRAGTDNRSQGTSLKCTSQMRMATTWLEAMVSSITIYTTTARQSKWGRTSRRRRHSSQLSICAAESTRSVAMTLTTKSSLILASTMT